MRNVLIPLVCLLLGLAAGYGLSVSVAPGAGEFNPAMVDESLRKNPRLVLEILQQYPEDVFDIVLAGQEVRQRKSRDEQVLHYLQQPIAVAYGQNRPLRGKADAPITIVEFSDFQCPHCSKAALEVEKVLHRYPDLVNLVFLHYPLSSHEYAPLAAAYFEAAALQDVDKAWQLHDVMFAQQETLGTGGGEWLKTQAEALGLDMERLQADLEGDEVKARLAADMEEVKRLGLRGTPSFVVGGVPLSGSLPVEEFAAIIDQIKMFRGLEPAAAQQPAPAS